MGALQGIIDEAAARAELRRELAVWVVFGLYPFDGEDLDSIHATQELANKRAAEIKKDYSRVKVERIKVNCEDR